VPCHYVRVSPLAESLTRWYSHVTSYFLFRHLPHHNFSNARPPAAQLAAVQKLIAFGVRRGSVRSDYRLRGHRDVSPSTCPGNVLYTNSEDRAVSCAPGGCLEELRSGVIVSVLQHNDFIKPAHKYLCIHVLF